MRGLILLTLLLMGCGSSNMQTSSGQGQSPQFIPPENSRIMGSLDTLVVLTSYQDAPCPFTRDQLVSVLADLNSLIVRNSTGRAWVTSSVAAVTLPRNAEAYQETFQVPDGTVGAPHTRLELDCVASIPLRRYTVFLLPENPVIYLGYGSSVTGIAFLSAWSGGGADPYLLPLPHEYGHELGFRHAATGIMRTDAAEPERDYNGMYDEANRHSAGWL